MKFLFKIFKILTPKQMRICTLLIIGMVIDALFEAFGIGAISPLVRIISSPNYLETHHRTRHIVNFFGIHTHQGFILFATVGVLCFYLCKDLFHLLQVRLQLAFSLSNQKDYTQRLYTYYMTKPYLFHVKMNSAVLIRNITRGAEVVFSNVLVTTLNLIAEFLTIFVILLLLLHMDRVIAIGVAVVLGPAIFLILKGFRRKISKKGEVQKKYSAEFTKWLQQGLGSIKETKVMQKEDYFNANFSHAYSQFSDASKDFMFINSTPRVFVELTGIAGLAFLVIIKILMNVEPITIVPSLSVLLLAIFRLMPCANRIINSVNSIKFNQPLFDEIFSDLLEVKILKDRAERNIKEEKVAKMPFERELSIKNISFTYPEKSEKVLDDISFDIPKGSFVGIVGPSGAGKTTFVDVLLGLLPPQSGQIYADGRDIYANISGWLYNVAYVPQTIYLIDGSIRENIALGIPEAEVTQEKIDNALKMAELYDFVQTLPQKDKTKTGEGGAMLSGGQKQRIGIARALFKNPEVLILDEATSALDNETERKFTETILKLKGHITIISIAHRLSTLEKCDFKIRFDKGKATILEEQNA